MAMFSGFKPSGMQKIANKMGYGTMDGSEESLKSFKDYISKDPTRQAMMNNYVTKAIEMANGGIVPSSMLLCNTSVNLSGLGLV